MTSGTEDEVGVIWEPRYLADGKGVNGGSKAS